jgi:MATE family multidrug resistance protein
MVANIALNYCLIEGRAGFPALGVRGAAWASVSASWLGFLAIFVLFGRGAWRERLSALRAFAPRELARVVRFGLPNGVNYFLEFAAFVLFINVVIGHLGTSVLAAFNVVLQINSISFMPAFGVASSGAILVGEAIGKPALDRVWPIVKLTGAVNAIWMGSVGLVYVAIPETLIGLFRPRDAPAETLVSVGATMLAMSCIWQLFDAAGMTLSEALRAAGDTAWCMIARIVLAWLVFTPAAWLAVLSFGGGVTTVMIALIAYMVALAAAFGWRFASGRWRDIDLVGSEPQLV